MATHTNVIVCLSGKTVEDFQQTIDKLKANDYKIWYLMKALAPNLDLPCQTTFAPLGTQDVTKSCITLYLMDDKTPLDIMQNEWKRTHGHPRLVLNDNKNGTKIKTHIWTQILGTPAAAIEIY